ncbi:MAG: Tfp pilus assembly protein FimT/FimU [Pirellulales bacterium]
MRVKSQERRVESQQQWLRLRARALTSDLRPLSSRRHALTLIELLVVIIILTTLVSAAIPLMAPTNDDRRLREASRSVNAFISAAQMKAIQLHRPVGVELKRLAQDTNSDPTQVHDDNAVCIELRYVEQPAPYRGFDRTSSAMIARHPDSRRTGQVLIRFVARNRGTTGASMPNGWEADLFPPNLIRPGDVIEIDGTRYGLLTLNAGGIPSALAVTQSIDLNPQNGTYTPRSGGSVVTLEAVPLNDTGQMLNIEFDANGSRIRDFLPNPASPPVAPFWTNPSPFKILRQPMPTSAEPFQMPEGTAIDLRASGQAIEIDGTGVSATANGFFYNPDATNRDDRVDNADSIVIMFTPEGAIERVRLNLKDVGSTNTAKRNNNIYDARTVSNIYLLVGRRQNAPPPAPDVDMTLEPSKYTTTTTDQQKQDFKEEVNWLRGESRWIVIGSQSGRVVTVDNAFVDPQPFFQTPEPKDIWRARQINASREFAREMVQVGGR